MARAALFLVLLLAMLSCFTIRAAEITDPDLKAKVSPMRGHSFLRDRFEAPWRAQMATPCRQMQQHQQRGTMSGAACGKDMQLARAAQAWCILFCKQHLCCQSFLALVAASIVVGLLQLNSVSMETLLGCTLADHSKGPGPLPTASGLPELHQHQEPASRQGSVILEPSSNETLLLSHLLRHIQVEDAEEAQQFGEDPIQPVEAQIVEEAPKAIVANGDGDVATTGEGGMQHAWARS